MRMGSSEDGRKALETADTVSSSEYSCKIALEKWEFIHWSVGSRERSFSVFLSFRLEEGTDCLYPDERHPV